MFWCPIVPRGRLLDGLAAIDGLELITNGEYKAKVAWLKGIHEQDIWRKELQPGIEYFTTPDFETHTFLNLMENPVATLCFQGRYDIFTSFEIRCIAQILDPRNPAITGDLLDIVVSGYSPWVPSQ